jgi:hypothetical protein
MLRASHASISTREYIRVGARRRRNGGGLGGGCARTPVGTYLYLHAVGASNPVTVPSLARQEAKRGTGSCDPRDQQL